MHIDFPEITTSFSCWWNTEKALGALSTELATWYYLPSYFSLFEHPNPEIRATLRKDRCRAEQVALLKMHRLREQNWWERHFWASGLLCALPPSVSARKTRHSCTKDAARCFSVPASQAQTPHLTGEDSSRAWKGSLVLHLQNSTGAAIALKATYARLKITSSWLCPLSSWVHISSVPTTAGTRNCLKKKDLIKVKKQSDSGSCHCAWQAWLLKTGKQSKLQCFHGC